MAVMKLSRCVRITIVVASGALSLGLASGVAPAAAQTATLQPFAQFVQQLSAAQSAAYVGVDRAADVAAFAEMRTHLLSLYSGVEVKHSYLLDEQIFDCVPVAQQPSVRLAGLKSVDMNLADAPVVEGAADVSDDAEITGQLDASETKDALGNAMECAEGTIPMLRVTLDDVARFGTLQRFFEKGPNGAGQIPAAPPARVPEHKYAHSYQFVKNIGGTANFNLWSPDVDTGKKEIFSLSQHWYTNNTQTLQTLEGGIQNYPKLYHTRKSVLFIYWTADAYNRTGCYNLDCRAFVQTNRKIHLGGRFKAYSVQGGKQRVINLETYHYQNKWIVYLNGNKKSNIIGYYPDSVYRGGTMSKAANEIDYGGETVGSYIWPPMGGGRFPSAGYGHASFVRDIGYFASASAAYKGYLTKSEPSPKCYKDELHNATRAKKSNTFFYYGGPGGKKC